MGQGGITGDNSIQSRSGSDASVMAYGTTGDYVVSYSKPTSLATLLGDTKSMLIAGVLLFVALKYMRKKKG